MALGKSISKTEAALNPCSAFAERLLRRSAQDAANVIRIRSWPDTRKATFPASPVTLRIIMSKKNTC